MNAINRNPRGVIRSDAKPTQGFSDASVAELKEQQPKQQQQNTGCPKLQAIKVRQQQEQHWQM